MKSEILTPRCGWPSYLLLRSIEQGATHWRTLELGAAISEGAVEIIYIFFPIDLI